MLPHLGRPVETAGAPLGHSPAVMIMLHGRNARPENILQTATELNRPDITYLAPAAADNSWYPRSFLAEIEQNEPGLSSSFVMLDHLITELGSKGFSRSQILLFGFSQGACVAAEYAVRNPTRYGGVIVLSGGLIGPPGTTWPERGSFSGTPVFLGCSDVDLHIPKTRVEESAGVFTRMGASVNLQIYPGMGHLVSDDELAVTRTLIDAVPREDRLASSRG